MSQAVVNRQGARASTLSTVHSIAHEVLHPQHPDLVLLARLRPGRVYRDIGRCYALIAAAWLTLALTDAWWIVGLPCFLLIGTQQYALSVLAHEGRHGRLMKGRRSNDRLTRLVLSAPLMHDAYYEAESALHFEHHRTMGTAVDPEWGLYASCDKATRSAVLLYLTGLPSVPRVLGKIARQSSTVVSGDHARNRLLAAWSPIVASQLLVLLLATMIASPWYYLWFWLAPLYVCVFIPKKLRVLCEHGRPILPDLPAEGDRLITFMPGPIERWLLAPMNMHYHAEHHLWPFVPYYSLPALHRLVAGTPAIEIRRSYIGYLRSYYRRLPLQESGVAVAQ